MKRLISVYDEDDRYQMLYDLLAQRRAHENISHRVMPSWTDHVAFVDSHPYEGWWFIKDGDLRVGAAYLSKNREVGLFLWPQYRGKGYGGWALKEIMGRYPGRLLANINPTNDRSIEFFKRHGFEQLQVTYELA